jgi:hypothetical protein
MVVKTPAVVDEDDSADEALYQGCPEDSEAEEA